MDGGNGHILYGITGYNGGIDLLVYSQVTKNGTIKKIAIGVAIVVFAALIISGIRGCRWMHDAVIRLEERSHK